MSVDLVQQDKTAAIAGGLSLASTGIISSSSAVLMPSGLTTATGAQSAVVAVSNIESVQPLVIRVDNLPPADMVPEDVNDVFRGETFFVAGFQSQV
jgi:hypothetical protein